MTEEERRRRAADPNVNYIRERICDGDQGKPFVFISYKSDDWETVLQDVVYRLVREYGLNVYFDGSFDEHNSLWINQFHKNMGSENCRGILAFLDNKYATSYATLMELMCSQCHLNGDYELSPLPVIPVNLDKLTTISDMGSTGLGEKTYIDGSKNNNAASEKELFDQLVEDLKAAKVFHGPLYLAYKDSKFLSKKLCSAMFDAVHKHLKVNDNRYDRGGNLSGIVGSIKDACGEDVFDQVRAEGPVGRIEAVPAQIWEPSPEPTAFAPRKTVEYISPPQNPVSVSRWLYRTKKGACAHILWDGVSKHCKVLKGSVAAKESEKFATSVPAAQKLKDQLAAQGILEGLVFAADCECDKVATMINLLNGGSVSMPAEMRVGNLAPDGGNGALAEPALPQREMASNFSGGQSFSEENTSGVFMSQAEAFTPVNAVSGETVYRYKNARIRCNIGSKVCTVLQGSRIQGESPKFATNAAGAKKLKDELRQRGIIVGDMFQADYTGSMATLLNLINGGSVSAPREKGKFVQEY